MILLIALDTYYNFRFFSVRMRREKTASAGVSSCACLCFTFWRMS